MISADRGREDRSAKECIDLFEEIAELYFPKATAEPNLAEEEGAESISLEAELAKELSTLKKTKKKQSKRFQAYVPFTPCCTSIHPRIANPRVCSVDTSCKNMVFIRFMDQIDPNAFVIKMFEHLTQEIKKPRTRYSNRILPIEKTCFVSEDKIVETISPAVERVFREQNPTKRPFKFRVDLKVRNNNVIDKDELKRKLAALVGRGHFVDLKSPDKILIVEVFAKAAGVAVVDNSPMDTYKGYNIRQVSATFGEPLPPFPDEVKNKERSKAQTATPSTVAETTELTSNGDEKAGSEAPLSSPNQQDNDDPSELPAEQVAPGAPETHDDGSDSDSDNGGISLF